MRLVVDYKSAAKSASVPIYTRSCSKPMKLARLSCWSSIQATSCGRRLKKPLIFARTARSSLKKARNGIRTGVGGLRRAQGVRMFVPFLS